MKLLFNLSVAAIVLLAASPAMSATKETDEHAAHHPASTAATAPVSVGYEQQMKMMQEMHQKMVAAKTPEERSALMKDHMKTMQDGMAMMGQMRGGMMGGEKGMGAGKGAMPMDPETMKRRMDMMEIMMQMMMDREGMKPPPAK